jgi:hypothetical protein
MRKLIEMAGFLALIVILPLKDADAQNRLVFNNLFYNVYDGMTTDQLGAGNDAQLTITDVQQAGPNTVQLAGEIRFTDPRTGKKVRESFSEVVGTAILSGASSGFQAQQVQQECPILFLQIAPIFLDVLGLTVELPNPLIVDITAVRGPGRLLGNLLCAILGLFDS